MSRLRWDRASRIAMLAVLAVVAFVGVEGVATLMRTRSQAEAQLNMVSRLARQNHLLAAEERALRQPQTIARDARALGMVKKGERSFVVTGLPSH